MPPVIKKRAKELVDVIRDCVKAQFQPTVTEVIAEHSENRDALAMKMSASQPLVPNLQDPRDLWSSDYNPFFLIAFHLCFSISSDYHCCLWFITFRISFTFGA